MFKQVDHDKQQQYEDEATPKSQQFIDISALMIVVVEGLF